MENSKLTHLESQIRELTHSFSSMSDTADLTELLKLIHSPGWTTPAELLLVTGVVETMIAQTKALAGLKKVLMTGSRAVGSK